MRRFSYYVVEPDRKTQHVEPAAELQLLLWVAGRTGVERPPVLNSQIVGVYVQ